MAKENFVHVCLVIFSLYIVSACSTEEKEPPNRNFFEEHLVGNLYLGSNESQFNQKFGSAICRPYPHVNSPYSHWSHSKCKPSPKKPLAISINYKPKYRDLKMVIQIKQVDPTRAEVAELIHQLDEYQESMYPPESNHLDSLDELSKSNVDFLAAYADSDICGIGAVKVLSDYGEIKRLYVPKKHRGKGVAKAIVKELENCLVKRSIFTARLETGIHQRDAIDLYKMLGYSRTAPFGDYTKDPLSVYMEKKMD